MLYVEDVPNNVAISEAVLLCRKYTTDESRSYINAVLGRLCDAEDAEDVEQVRLFKPNGKNGDAR